MNIFVIGADVPYRHHGNPGVEAANIVLYELVIALSRSGHKIVLQLLFNQHRPAVSLNPSEEDELRQITEHGIEVLPPIYFFDYQPTRGRPAYLRKIIGLIQRLSPMHQLAHYYPAVKLRGVMRERIQQNNCDAVLTVWSPEGVAATHGLRETPRIAYHGDVDYVPGKSRLTDEITFSAEATPRFLANIRGVLRKLYGRFEYAGFRRSHLKLMKDLQVIANITASNAAVYTNDGHPNSIYVGNTWSDPGIDQPTNGAIGAAAAPSSKTIKIIGHVGNLQRTGSTYGLRFLLLEVLPELEKVADGLDYQIHIIGDGEIVKELAPFLDNERIVMRGFVEDLDAELKSADMLLLLNNAGSYLAAYTRHMVSWSMGLCLIVHANSISAIPEISPMENALVGSTPEEVARMILLAATDLELNLRVRQGGRATYEQYFMPSVIAGTLEKEISLSVAVTVNQGA